MALRYHRMVCARIAVSIAPTTLNIARNSRVPKAFKSDLVARCVRSLTAVISLPLVNLSVRL